MRRAAAWAVSVALLAAMTAQPERTTESYDECAALLDAHDWDGASCATQWPDLTARSVALWGQDLDPETGHYECAEWDEVLGDWTQERPCGEGEQ